MKYFHNGIKHKSYSNPPFVQGEDPSLSSPNFWDELSLLKVNIAFLERCVMLTSEDGLISMKDVLNKIFYHSLQAMKETNLFRKAHGMEVCPEETSTNLRPIFSLFKIIANSRVVSDNVHPSAQYISKEIHELWT